MFRHPSINDEGLPLIGTIGQVVPSSDIPQLKLAAALLNLECAIPEIDYVPEMYIVDLHPGAYDVDYRGRRMSPSSRRIVLRGEWQNYDQMAGYRVFVDRYEALRDEFADVDDRIQRALHFY